MTAGLSEHDAPSRVGEQAAPKCTLKRCGGGAVDDRWSHDNDSGSVSRHCEVFPSPTPPCFPSAATRRDRHLGRVDDRREVMPPMPPSEADREGAALTSGRASACLRARSGEVAHLLGDLHHPFWSASRITGTTRPFGVSAAKPMCQYFFSTRLSPSSEALNSGTSSAPRPPP